MENLLHIEELAILLLSAALGVGLLVRKLRMPYTVGLVLMGLGIALFTNLNIAEALTPDLILGLLVPPLVFEAAFHIRLDMLRRDLGLIMALAVPGVILTMLLVGWLVSIGTGFGLTVSLLFGALIAATDPVAVVALFRSLGVPKRLQVLLEGESLMNDGTAIVIFSLVLAILQGGEFVLTRSIADFFRIAGGGFLIGMLLGGIASEVTRFIDEHLIETALTTVLAFGAYLLAEQLHVSGVLAVVAAGLISGNVGPRGMSPTTRIVVFNFWEFAAFLANSFVFLLIGMQIRPDLLLANWLPILWAILAVLLARLVSVYGFAWFARDLPLKWRHVLYWGGLRGAISLALALGLPAGLEERPALQAMAFGVVLFTLLVQGTTMGTMVRRLQLVQRSPAVLDYEQRHARSVAARAAFEHVQSLYRQGLLTGHTWRHLKPLLEQHMENQAQALQVTIHNDPSVEERELETARREALMAQRSVLNRLFVDGVISEETFHALVGEVDTALEESEASWVTLVRASQAQRQPIRHLMLAIVQKNNLSEVMRALREAGCTAAALPAQGGYSRQPNTTLLIGLPEGKIKEVIALLQQRFHKKVELGSLPLENLPLPPARTVRVGDVTAFVFPVERFEQF